MTRRVYKGERGIKFGVDFAFPPAVGRNPEPIDCSTGSGMITFRSPSGTTFERVLTFADFAGPNGEPAAGDGTDGRMMYVLTDDDIDIDGLLQEEGLWFYTAGFAVGTVVRYMDPVRFEVVARVGA